MQPKQTLRPIKPSQDDFERLEEELKKLFKEIIYKPLMKVLGEPATRLTNSSSALCDALQSGRVFFWQGRFGGRLNGEISGELRRLGARWNKKLRTWDINKSELPLDVKNAIGTSEFQFTKKMEKIDAKLAEILPEEITDKLQAAKFFDASLWKVDKDFRQSVKALTIEPTLTKEARKRISVEWQKNMDLWVTDFTKAEIIKLRSEMQTSVFKGNRYEGAVKTIQDSYEVSKNKAKFLARQETSLLMSKFVETQYQELGINTFVWGCVAGSPLHPVRPAHKLVEGKIFRWDDPRERDEKGQLVKSGGVRKPGDNLNPGEDYNCRCFAKPIVKF